MLGWLTEKKFRQSQLFDQEGETNAWLDKPELDKEAKTSNYRKAEWEAKKEQKGRKTYSTRFRSGRFVRKSRWDAPRSTRSAYEWTGRQEAVREIPRNLQHAPAPAPAAKDAQQCYRCHQFGEIFEWLDLLSFLFGYNFFFIRSHC